MTEVLYTNIQFKTILSGPYQILLALYDEFTRVDYFHTVMDEVPAIFIDANARIKDVQIVGHDLKQ